LTSAIRFEFKPLSEINEDYKIFLHLFPQSGGEMLNRDFRPEPPTSQWQPGVVSIQRKTINLEPGKYRAEVGFFGKLYRFMMTVK